MKIIIKENLFLERLQEKDIELIRKWRNAPEISQFMEYRDFITPEMQKKWFRSVNNNNNIYLVANYKGREIGLGNVKNIDWDRRTMEAGLFIWDKEVQNSPIPLLGFMFLADIGILRLNLTGHCHILKSNKRAQRFNKQIGFELCEGQENVENQKYRLTRESYRKKTDVFRKSILKDIDKEPIRVIFEEHDRKDGFAEFLESQFDPETIDNIEETEEGRAITFKMV